jgi:hypothetical protein
MRKKSFSRREGREGQKAIHAGRKQTWIVEKKLHHFKKNGGRRFFHTCINIRPRTQFTADGTMLGCRTSNCRIESCRNVKM